MLALCNGGVCYLNATRGGRAPAHLLFLSQNVHTGFVVFFILVKEVEKEFQRTKIDR